MGKLGDSRLQPIKKWGKTVVGYVTGSQGSYKTLIAFLERCRVMTASLNYKLENARYCSHGIRFASLMGFRFLILRKSHLGAHSEVHSLRRKFVGQYTVNIMVYADAVLS